MAYTVTMSGFRRIATVAGAVVEEDVSGGIVSHHICHPETGGYLQRNHQGYVSVHVNGGSWSSAENPVSVLTSMWKGDF